MSQRFTRVDGFDIGGAGASNTQGVATDGTYVWISEGNEIYRFTYEGDFLNKHDCTPDGTNNHLGGLTVVGNDLYVTTSQYPTTPYNMYVKHYNATTLAYIGEHFIHADYIGEDIKYKDGRFWFMVDNFNRLIFSTDASFGDKTDYKIPSISTDFFGNNNGWNGFAWVGDMLYAQPHGGTYPDKVQRFEWHPETNTFTYEEELWRPVPREFNGQGMDYNIATEEFLFAGRDPNNAGSDEVTFARLEDVDPALTTSDLDAFKNSGAVQVDSITLSDTVGGGDEYRKEITFDVENPDLFQVLYDNSVYHNNKFKPLHLAPVTAMPDDITFGGDGTAWLYVEVEGNQITVGVYTFNPYASTLTIGPVTYEFRLVPYETTF